VRSPRPRRARPQFAAMLVLDLIKLRKLSANIGMRRKSNGGIKYHTPDNVQTTRNPFKILHAHDTLSRKVTICISIEVVGRRNAICYEACL